MNAIELVEQSERAAPVNVPAIITPTHLLQIAYERGATIEQMERLYALKLKVAADEALQAFNVAFAAFKDEAVRIIKNRKVTDGPLRGKSYAELHAVVNAVTPALSAHGLSASWRITKDERDWLEVTCSLKHAQGHSEQVSMGGPPDAGGAKNAIMARASTVTYLERYTLKAILGLSEQDEDDDGAGGRDAPPPPPAPLPPPETAAAWPADAFSKQFARWQQAVENGIKNKADILAMARSKGALSAEQEAAINDM